MADVGQRLEVAHVGAHAEIGRVEQRLDHAVLVALLAGEADEPDGRSGCWACG